jgi:hypothetical protein
MVKSIFVAFAVAQFLFVSAEATADQVYKCNVNGSVHYQQSPCQTNKSRKPPTVQELNAERQKQLAQEGQRSTSPMVQAQTSAKPEASAQEPAKLLLSPRTSLKCDNRKYCTQMTSCAEAKYFLSNCPNVKMDGDGDGIPCEEQLCGH